MRTVLVVDDELGIVESLGEVLGDEGFAVVTARNGKDGLRKLLEQRPDVVLLDYMMPVMDGADMLRELARSETHRAIPVVMMSAAPRKNLPADCQPAGYLRKPFDVDELLLELNRVLAASTV